MRTTPEDLRRCSASRGVAALIYIEAAEAMAALDRVRDHGGTSVILLAILPAVVLML